MLTDADFAADLIARVERGRAQATAVVNDIHVARLGRYVVCYRLAPAASDYTLYFDIWAATEAYTRLLVELHSGLVPAPLVP